MMYYLEQPVHIADYIYQKTAEDLNSRNFVNITIKMSMQVRIIKDYI